MKRASSLIMAGLLLLTMAACGSNPVQADKVFANYGIETELSSMDAQVVTDGTSFTIIENTTEGLTQFDKNSVIVPAIAESWEISEDGMTYTFHLRKDAKWSNGTPVTANDFIFAWKRLADPATASDYQFFITDVSGIRNANAIAAGTAALDSLGAEAPDEHTLVVYLERPVPYFLSLVLFPPMFPVNEEFYNSVKELYGQSKDATLANGPFMLTYWEQGGTQITVERNPEYYAKDEVTIDGVNFVVVKDAQSALLAYRNGDIDKFTLTGELVEQFENDPEFSIVDGSYLWYILVNHKEAHLDNAELRLALATAYDKQAICSGILKDGSVPADYFVPTKLATGPDGKDFRETSPVYLEYNPASALAHWEKAKKELAIDSLEISLIVEDTESAIAVATFIQDAIQKNLPGITVKLETMSKKARLQRQSDKDYQLSLTRWGPDYSDPMTYLEQFKTNTTSIGWDNARYDALVDEVTFGRTALEPAARWEMMKEIEKELLQNADIMPVYQKNNAVLQKKNLTGIEEHMTIGNLFKHAVKTTD